MTSKLSKRNDQGNSFVVYVMMMLLMLGIFGLAVDTALNVYTRNAIQSAMDTATRAAAQSTTVNNNGKVVINAVEARKVVDSTYTKNRPGSGTSGGAMLVCQNHGGKCYRAVSFRVGTDAKTGQQYVEFRVRERRNNLFLNFVGVDTQDFEIVSRARFAANLERR